MADANISAELAPEIADTPELRSQIGAVASLAHKCKSFLADYRLLKQKQWAKSKLKTVLAKLEVNESRRHETRRWKHLQLFS